MLKNYRELNVWQKETRRGGPQWPPIKGAGAYRRPRTVLVQGRRRGALLRYSNCELKTQILLSGDLGFMNAKNSEEFLKDVGNIERMLKGPIKSLEKTPEPVNPRILEPSSDSLENS